jgi:hypothetical protein
MRKIKLTTLAGLMLVSMAASAANTSEIANLKTDNALAPVNIDVTVAKLEAKAPDLNPAVLKLALKAYNKARKQGYDQKQILSVIDFSIPTNHKSLWIFDLKKDSVLYNTYVAHGKGSGLSKATHFSNVPGSEASSLGVYVTGNTYYGSDGYSLRLHGLSAGFNDKAYSRAIVMHGAWYVAPKFVNQYHRAGRSWGCTAVSKKLAKPVINTVKNGTLIFAYGNDKNWFAHGPYVA